jgi:hypothetical protein
MRNIRAVLLAGVASLALAGFSGSAAARDPDTHVLNVPLPGGYTEQIRYTGDIAPAVVVTPGPVSAAAFAPMFPVLGLDPTFATMERISAAMDRQMASLLRQAESLAAQTRFGPSQLTEAALRNLPPGSQSFSYISTMSGNGVCTRSIEITSTGNGGPPRVVSHSSGNCGPQPGSAGSINLPAAPPPSGQPDMLWTKHEGAQPYGGIVREAAWQH